MATPAKEKKVAQLVESLKQASAVYLTNYQGLTHKELENLRTQLKPVNAKYTIVKNSLLSLALKQYELRFTNYDLRIITGPTAILLTYSDPIKPLQLLKNILKDRLKGAVAFGEYLTGVRLQQLIELEPLEVLQTKLVSQFSSPFYNLTHALKWNLQKLTISLKEISKQKEKSH